MSQELRRCSWPRWRGRASTTWPASEEFTSAVEALAAGELDPYEVADRLLGRMTTPPCSWRTAPATVRR